MAPQQQQQQQERDPNLSAVAQPTGQGVNADGHANLRAIVTSLRKADPNASPDTIMRATMERIQMLKGVQPEVKDAMMMQFRTAKLEQDNNKLQFSYDKLQRDSDDKIQGLEAKLAVAQRGQDLAHDDRQASNSTRRDLGNQSNSTRRYLGNQSNSTRIRGQNITSADRVKAEGGRASRFTQSQADKGANRDLKRVLGDNVNLTRVAQTYMKSHPSATPEAAAAYAKKIAPPGGANTPSASAPDAEKAWLKSAAKINKSAAVAKYEQRHGKGSAAAVLGGR